MSKSHLPHLTKHHAWGFVIIVFATMMLCEGCVARKLLHQGDVLTAFLVVVGWFKEAAHEVIRKLIE